MSDFDNVKIGDWVRIEHDFAKEGARLAYTVTYEGFVTDRGAGLLRISESGDGVWVSTSDHDDPGVTVRLVEHLQVREVGWHEVTGLEVGAAVRWWDGAWWRHSPTGPSTGVNYGSGHYLGRGAQ